MVTCPKSMGIEENVAGKQSTESELDLLFQPDYLKGTRAEPKQDALFLPDWLAWLASWACPHSPSQGTHCLLRRMTYSVTILLVGLVTEMEPRQCLIHDLVLS